MAKHPGTVDQSKGTEKKTACITPISRTSKRLQQKRSIDEVKGDQLDLSQSLGDSKKIEFQCPVCEKVFPVYFSAYKHIQKRHCENENGEPVEPDSQDLIKPIRIEICVLCCTKIHDDNHKCQKPKKSQSNGIYVCLGCNRKHSTVNAFDTHVSQYHSDGVKDMFFPDYNEFMKWKLNMETQVRVKYLSLSNTVIKQYYQCNYVSPKNSTSVTHLCPSIVTVREYLKGFQVHYYKNHYDHCCPEYEVHEHFEKYENKNDVSSSKPKDNQLYDSFKLLIGCITKDAGKIKAGSLRHLYAKALEMRNYLDSVDHEEHEEEQSNAEFKNGLQIKNAYSLADDQAEISVTNKSMTDDQISQALGGEAKTSERLKRKSGNDDAMPAKKKKDDNTKDKQRPFESPKIVSQSLSNQSPSFNDSYKQFVDTTLKDTDNVTSSRKGRSRQAHIKKEIVKTKIGQFIPSPTKSLINKESDSPLKVNKKSAQLVQSPTKSTVSKEQDSLLKVNKKSVQFIASPTKSPLNKESDSLLKVKKKSKGKVITTLPLDVSNIKYKVVEQENDCNILVLKF